MASDSYQQIVTLCRTLLAKHAQEVTGQDYGEEMASKIVYDTRTLADGEDKATINATRDDVRPPFEWLVEITTWGALGVHVLLYPDGRMVEAYGHKLFDLSEDSASELNSFITRLSETA